MGEPYYQDDAVTIYHGDCREIMPDLEYDCILADPPYGISVDTSYSRRVSRDKTGATWAGRDHPPVFGDDTPFNPQHLLDDRPIILWGADFFRAELPAVGSWLVWDKRLPSGKRAPVCEVEMAWCSSLTNPRIFAHMWSGFYRASEVGHHVHPTQKPVALMSWCLGFLPDGVVLDPYIGSGPTLRAAKDLGRKAIGIEIEEQYCEIAANRMRQEVLAL